MFSWARRFRGGKKLTADQIFTTTVVRDDEALLVVGGEIDAVTAADLDRTLHKLLTRSRHVLVDMAGVTFLGMDGVRVLSAARYRAARTGRSFRVISMSVTASRIFTLLAELSIGPDRAAGNVADLATSHLAVTVPQALHSVEPLISSSPMDVRARFEDVAADYHAVMASVADSCHAASSTYLKLGRAQSGARRAYYRQRTTAAMPTPPGGSRTRRLPPKSRHRRCGSSWRASTRPTPRTRRPTRVRRRKPPSAARS